MNFYYGLVDEQNHAYGFVEETDKRVKPGMIYVTEAEWSNLLNEQSAGKQIVFYDNRVFTAEPGLYFIDTNGVWQKKDTDKFQKEKRLQEIETELATASSEYETLLETPVVYPANGFTYKPSSNQFSRWVKGDNGKILQGLVKRRNMEKELFLKDSCKKAKVTATVLNIRTGAGTNYKVVGYLPKNAIVSLTDASNGFAKLLDGRGWVSQKYLTYM